MATITSRKNKAVIAPSTKMDMNSTDRTELKLQIRVQFPIARMNKKPNKSNFFLDFII